MKPDPIDQFLTTWPTKSPNHQLLALLCLLVSKAGGSIEVDPEELLDIQDGEAVLLTPEASKLMLRYSPVQTLVYSIQKTGAPWRNETPASTLTRSFVQSDESMAEQESLMAQRRDIQAQAAAMREPLDPLTGSLNLSRVKTSRSTAKGNPQ